jgi:hypothetical protein
VGREWLEDCLLTKTEKQKRARPEKGYTISRQLARVNKSAKEQKKYRASFEEGVRAGHVLVDNSKFPSFFAIILAANSTFYRALPRLL